MAGSAHQSHCRCREDNGRGRQPWASFRGTEDHSRSYCAQWGHGGRSSPAVESLCTELTTRPIIDDKQPNRTTYNEELRRMNRPTWRNVSWLYSECYLYRYFPGTTVTNSQTSTFDVRVNHILEELRSLSPTKGRSFQGLQNGCSRTRGQIPWICWNSSTTFHSGRFGDGKTAIRTTSHPIRANLISTGRNGAHLLMGQCLRSILFSARRCKPFARKRKADRCKQKHHCGNLPPETGLPVNAPANALLLQNDLAAAWSSIRKLKNARIDIILDNAGFELYADLIFTLYLLTVGIAGTVVLHPKSIPW